MVRDIKIYQVDGELYLHPGEGKHSCSWQNIAIFSKYIVTSWQQAENK